MPGGIMNTPSNKVARYQRSTREFVSALQSLSRTGLEISEMLEDWPSDLLRPLDTGLSESVVLAKKMIDRMVAHLIMGIR